MNCGTIYRDREPWGRNKLRERLEQKFSFKHVKSEFSICIPGEMIHRQLVTCVWKVR